MAFAHGSHKIADHAGFVNIFGAKKVNLKLRALGKSKLRLPVSLVNVRSPARPRSLTKGSLSFELGPYGFQILVLTKP